MQPLLISWGANSLSFLLILEQRIFATLVVSAQCTFVQAFRP